MGKKRDRHSEDLETSPKKSKKPKKITVKSTETDDGGSEMNDSVVVPSPTSNKSGTPMSTSKTTTGKKKKSLQTAAHDDTDSEAEERWLNAIESGKLEEVDDELKKIKPKDPKLMTARQRAMYEKTSSDSKDMSPVKGSRRSLPTTTLIDGVQANVTSSGQLLLALPNFKHKEKEKAPLTAEDLEREKEKAQKRKALADEKREKDKKKTMERLLKKQDSKMVKSTRNRPVKQLMPMISYKNTADLITLSFPVNFECPVKPLSPIEPPKAIICSIKGCKNMKRYNCSKTNVPLCSLECYKKNVESVKQMIF